MSGSLAAWLGSLETVPFHRPWPRASLDAAAWRRSIELLGENEWRLVGLWADQAVVHMALLDESEGSIAVLSHVAENGRYPAVSPVRPGAQRLERAIRDLHGLEAEGAADLRPWLDHGRWPESRPLAAVPGPASDAALAYSFRAAEGEGLHEVPVGPVHAGIIEPGQFRFHCSGETVVRLEERLGWTHKGIEALMAGRLPLEAAPLAGRISGDSTVAYSLAFAAAVEAALGGTAPPRATALRAVMAELERLANHLGDIGAISNDAAFALMLARTSCLREGVLRAAATAFGHRLMMDRVVPGGVAADITGEGIAAIRAAIAAVRAELPELVLLYDGRPSLADRMVGTGTTDPALARAYGAGGYVGRAAGRRFDARLMPGYAPYAALELAVPVRREGDVDARVRIRIEEVAQSLQLVDRLLLDLPAGPCRRELPEAGAAEGMALVEGFRGDVLVWVRLAADGRIARCHARDPSWFQWPLLEAAIEGNILADFPLCNKSFNCSYSGVDL